MWTKNILRAFSPDTNVKLTIDGKLIEDITTVKDYMDNGLMNYAMTQDGDLSIENDTIIITVLIRS